MKRAEKEDKQRIFTWDNIKTFIYILSAIEFTYLIFYFLFVVLPFTIICFLIEYFSQNDSHVWLVIMNAIWFYIPIAFVLIYTIYFFASGKHKKTLEDMKKERMKDIMGR